MSQLDRIEDRWRRALAAWSVPSDVASREGIDPPWQLDPAAFAPDPHAPLSPSHLATRRLVLRGHERSLIDVGSGVGAAFWPVAGELQRVLAIDENPAMLAALLAEARSHPTLLVETRVGRLQVLLDELDPADVVTSHHVVYNVPELGSYLAGLLRLARVGVVLELTLHHPHYRAAAMFEERWGRARPTTPSAADVVEALWVLGARPQVIVHDVTARSRDANRERAQLRRSLCLRQDEDAVLRRLLESPGELMNPLVTVVAEVASGAS